MRFLNLEKDEKEQNSNEKNNNMIDNKDNYRKGDKFAKILKPKKKKVKLFIIPKKPYIHQIL